MAKVNAFVQALLVVVLLAAAGVHADGDAKNSPRGNANGHDKNNDQKGHKDDHPSPPVKGRQSPAPSPRPTPSPARRPAQSPHTRPVRPPKTPTRAPSPDKKPVPPTRAQSPDKKPVPPTRAQSPDKKPVPPTRAQSPDKKPVPPTRAPVVPPPTSTPVPVPSPVDAPAASPATDVPADSAPTDSPSPDTPADAPAPDTPAVTPSPDTTPAVTPSPDTPAVTPSPDMPAVTPSPNMPAATPSPDMPAAVPSPANSPVPSPVSTPAPQQPTLRTVSSFLFGGGSLSIKPNCTVETCLTTNNISNHVDYIPKAYRAAGAHPDTFKEKLCDSTGDVKCLLNTQVKNYTHYTTNNTVFQLSNTTQDFNRTGFTVGANNSIQWADTSSFFNSGRWIWKEPSNAASLVNSDVTFQDYKWDLNKGSAYFANTSASWNNTGFQLNDTLLGVFNSNLSFLGTGVKISATNTSEYPGVYLQNSTLYAKSVSLTFTGIEPIWLQNSKLVLIDTLLTLEAGSKMFITDGVLYLKNSRIKLSGHDSQLHLWGTRIHGDNRRSKRVMSHSAENILWNNATLAWVSSA